MEQWYGYIGLIVTGAPVTAKITALGCAMRLVGVFFLAVSVPSAIFQRRLEKRFAPKQR